MSNTSIHMQKQHAARLLQSNRADDARKVLSKLCSRTKKDAEAWYMLGIANSMLGSQGEAEKCLRQAISFAPGNFQAHNNLGSALRAQCKFKEALSQFDKAIRISPGYTIAHFNRGGVLQELGNIDGAIASYRRASTLSPQDPDIHYSLAEAFSKTRDMDSALKHYQQALRIKPGLLNAVTRIADIYKAKKQFTEAFKMLEPYVQGGPGEVSINVALNYARLCRHTGRYDNGINLLERIRNASLDAVSVEDQMEMCFGLGNLYDARGDYKDAFSNYNTGNKLKPSSNNDEEYSANGLRETMTVFTPRFLERAPRANNTSESPVFIIGMPRSGTSLVEQILCTHPTIFGAGEVAFLRETSDELQKVIGSALPYPNCLQEINQAHSDSAAINYLVKLSRLSTGNELRITDKMPGNYWNLGLIYLLFPKARIIHCIRNPLDTCLSIYFQSFGEAHGYANDLKSIGRIYNIYRQLMEHWRRVLEYPILDIHYEELVTSQEATSRRLVDYCGLPWDERCLQFQDNPRTVMTASQDQVHRALYKTSIHRWKNYQPFIGPLLAELGNYQI